MIDDPSAANVAGVPLKLGLLLRRRRKSDQIEIDAAKPKARQCRIGRRDVASREPVRDDEVAYLMHIL